ncbi:protein kinase [Streptomyces sp. DSM 40473]|uniref:non-specific serine/threonine protein kinase n=2 Tax=Streptomyces hesseae TaxID=3075519 RepID=A0ABU2SWU9_9ACTN|nr:protein kinase [Streptomyces sp. DSM 40473]MDT0452399.1 protein kinase [Streptomyces sp. DSM 40473]
MLVAGRYRLGDPLGRGGMGEVWQGQDEVLGRQVAVKLLLGDDGDESAAMRFRMEAQTAARLNHPQVVAVYDFGEWEGRFYLVMELVQGSSLSVELAERRALAPARAADLVAQTASGLAAAHRQGVVHRDVKPGNLMVDAATGTLKIGDFGIARFVDETSAGLTRAGQIVGTSTYLAPERALGRTAGPESDVYALGCVLYQMLVGRPPFWDENPTALLYLHVDSPPEPPRHYRPDVPPAFEAYLLRMLAKQPEERPSAQEVADFFSGTAWRGTPQPLSPMTSPTSPFAPGVPQAAAAQSAAGPAAMAGAPVAPPSIPAVAPSPQSGIGPRTGSPAAPLHPHAAPVPPVAMGAPPMPSAPPVPPIAAAMPPPASAPAAPLAPGSPVPSLPPSLQRETTTTYALPSARTRAAAAVGAAGRRRPKVLLAAVAGVMVFVVAVLIGAALF